MKDVRAELIRIDTRGEGHPIGTIASQRMRSRAGTYRLLPAPEHVVFMRYTGEDGQRDDEDGAVVRLAGEITAPGALCDILAVIAQGGWRGELSVREGVSERSLFLDQGYVVGVTTNVEQERLGQVLYSYGAIDQAQHRLLMDRVRNGRRFGEAAVDLKLLKQEQVYKYIGKQIEEVVYSTMLVSDGTFFFLEGFDDSRLVSTHMMSANALLMDGVTRMDEMRYFREKIPSSLHVPAKQPGRGSPADDYRAVWQAIDGTASIGDLGRSTGLGEFETTKQLYALLQSKHIVISMPNSSGGLSALIATANEALRDTLARVDAIAADNAKWPNDDAIDARWLDEENGDTKQSDEDGAAATRPGQQVRDNLAGFAIGAGVYELLLRDAGPAADGTLDIERVTQNVSLLATTDDPEPMLRQMLYEYVGFAVFSAGAALGPEAENELNRRVRPLLEKLAPHA